MVSPPLLQQHQTLLRHFSNSLVDGIANKPCTHIHEVFRALLDATYIGLEVVLSEKTRAIALFQHDAHAQGRWLVPPINTCLVRNLPMSIKAPPEHPHRALVRVPMLCCEQALAELLLSKDLYNTWLAHAQHAPVVGSVLLAVSTQHTSHFLDEFTANALITATYMAPLVIEKAKRHLLLAALTAGALPVPNMCGGGDIVYKPGMGFVHQDVEQLDSSSADAARLMQLLNAPLEDNLQHNVMLDVLQGLCAGQYDSSDHASSSGSMDSVNNGDEEGAIVEQPIVEQQDAEPGTGATSRRNLKRQRCAEDAHSWVSHRQDEDEDDVADSGCDDSAVATRTSGSNNTLQQTSQGNDGSAEDNGKTHTQRAVAPPRLLDGLQYADADIEGRYLLFMHHDIAWVKRCTMALFFLALAWRCWHIGNSGSALWDVQTMTTLAMVNAGFMSIMQCLPIFTARQARHKELLTFLFFVLVGTCNAVLLCRYCLHQLCKTSWSRAQSPVRSIEGWQLMLVFVVLLLCSASRNKRWLKFAGLAALVSACIVTFSEEFALVLHGQQLMDRTLPFISVLNLVSNGGALRFLRHAWAVRVSQAKYIAVLSFLATTALTNNPATPWWALAGVALLAHVTLHLTSFTLALEQEQRMRFEHTVLRVSHAQSS